MIFRRRSALAPARVFAWLRVGAVPLVALSESTFVRDPDAIHPAFVFTVAAFAVYALVTLLWLDPSERRQDVYTAIDVAFSGVLSYTSSGGLSNLRFLSVIVLVSTIFRLRPRLTAVASGAVILGYVVQAAAVHVSRRHGVNEQSIFTIQTGYLVWMGAAATALTTVLARHQRRIDRLLMARQELVVEALGAEERERKRVAEEIHDHAIQHLLAARHELEAAADADPTGPVGRAHAVLTETVGALRRTMADLHPYLLDTLGLGPALTAIAERSAERGGFRAMVVGALDHDGGNDRLVLRAVTELLANAIKHASATTVTVTLETSSRGDVVTVTDDGVGFDPSLLDGRIRDGHIGLVSIRERADALGGSFTISSALGHGARFALTLPRR